MADLSISPEEIRGALDSFMESYRPADVATEEVGHVIETADGIAHVEGLPGTMANELLRFEDGTLGLAMNLDQREIGAVVLGDFGGIEEGQVVHRTGEVLSVPVGDGYLGRTVDSSAARSTASVISRIWMGVARSNCRPPASWHVRACTSPLLPA